METKISFPARAKVIKAWEGNPQLVEGDMVVVRGFIKNMDDLPNCQAKIFFGNHLYVQKSQGFASMMPVEYLNFNL